MAIATINPATGETLHIFQPLSEAEIEKKLQLAVAAFRAERKTSFADRAKRMTKAAEILETGREKFGTLVGNSVLFIHQRGPNNVQGYHGRV